MSPSRRRTASPAVAHRRGARLGIPPPTGLPAPTPSVIAKVNASDSVRLLLQTTQKTLPNRLLLPKERRDCMFILSTILTCATLGGTLGGAIATIAGTSVATGTAIGTVAGAGTGVVVGLAELEAESNCEYA